MIRRPSPPSRASSSAFAEWRFSSSSLPAIIAASAGGRVHRLAFVTIGRDLERLLEEAHGLDERAQRSRPLGRAAQRDPGLGGDRFALRPIGLGLVGGHVVLGQRPGDPLVVERLEVARRGEVQPPPIAAARACRTPPRG